MRTQNNKKHIWTVAVPLVVVATAVAVGAQAPDWVLLRDVDALVFRKGEDVVDTRTGEVLPRLQCAYNPLDDPKFLPSSVMCKNKGVDDNGGIVWKCTADLDDALVFDNVQVSCEGYSHPGDQYIRKGTCTLSYTLALTPAAAQKQQKQQQQQQQQQQTGYHNRQPRPDPQEQGYNSNNNGRPHYYANINNNNNNNNVGEARVVSVWTFSNVLLVVLATYVVGRCLCRCCASKPARVANNFEHRNVENNDVHTATTPAGSSTSRSGWRWWFPLAAYALGRHEANRARNSRVYDVPPPQPQSAPAYGGAAPSAPAADTCGASGNGRDSDSDSDSPATGHVSRRTGYANTVVR